jgi:hypothetical protein
MRRSGLGGMTVALVMGLGVAVATTHGAEYEGKPPAANGLLSGLFHEKPRGQTKGAAKAVDDKPPEPTSTVESAHALQQRYQSALLRRMAVCDRLQLIANQTGNEALRNQAFELEQRANAIYLQQTAGLPLPMPNPGSLAAKDAQFMAGGNAGQVLAQEAEGTTGGARPPLAGVAPSLGGSSAAQEHAILNGTKRGE